ncbi:MAG: HXXEE domain-containing protein [Enterococcus sp.]
MKTFINKWYQVGALFFVLITIYLVVVQPEYSATKFLLILNLLALFAHQFEEYQFPGGAPLIINRVVYDETKRVDHYPGNSLSIMLVNVSAWVIYAFSIEFSTIYWFGTGIIFFSLFQILGHVLQMNIKLKTWYNPGMFTTIFFFTPIGMLYLREVIENNLVEGWQWAWAILVFIGSILISIVAPVQLLKNEKTRYVIAPWQVERFNKIMAFAKIKK